MQFRAEGHGKKKWACAVRSAESSVSDERGELTQGSDIDINAMSGWHDTSTKVEDISGKTALRTIQAKETVACQTERKSVRERSGRTSRESQALSCGIASMSVVVVVVGATGEGSAA